MINFQTKPYKRKESNKGPIGVSHASIRCYFDTTILKQSGFCTTYSLKIVVSERK